MRGSICAVTFMLIMSDWVIIESYVSSVLSCDVTRLEHMLDYALASDHS